MNTTWLADLANEAAKLDIPGKRIDFVPNTFIIGPSGRYGIGKILGKTSRFNSYICALEGGDQGILKIASTTEYNSLLDREAMILTDMASEAIRLEEKYARVKEDKDSLLNYQICFPHLVESFIAPTQGDRRVSILTFPAVEDIGTLVPLGHLASRDHVRVDRKTSAWMMGKFLKILVFAHSQNISVNEVTCDNILIERDQHYVIIFDWTLATIHQGGVPHDITREDISRGAGEIIRALGGDPSSGELPNDDQDLDGRYRKYLYDLVRGNEHDASYAHECFYTLVRSLWPRVYWPFTTYNL